MWVVVAVTVLALVLCVASSSPGVKAQQTTTSNSTSTTDEECSTETSTINSDAALQQALVDLKTNISTALESDFYQFCSILEGGCTVNLTSYYPPSLTSDCSNLGGQLAKQRASLKCTGKVLGIPIPGGVKFEFVDIPACVGQSCDLSGGGVPTIVEDALDQVLDEVGQIVETGLDDGNCTAAIGSSASERRWSIIVSVTCTVLIGWWTSV